MGTAIAVSVAAVLVGASVSAQTALTVKLNRRSDTPWHAVYVSAISGAIGLALVGVPTALSACHEPCPPPRRWWTLLGGLAILPSVATIPSAGILGVQVTSLAMIGGQMMTSLTIDYFEGSARLDAWTLGSLALVLGGAGCSASALLAVRHPIILAKGAHASPLSLVAEPFGGEAVAYLLLSGLAGAGYALRSRCSRELSRDLDSDVRATCALAACTQLALLPIWAALWASGSVEPVVDLAADWWAWALCGAQFAAYVFAMTARHLAHFSPAVSSAPPRPAAARTPRLAPPL